MAWSPEPWTTVGSAGPASRTPDLTPVLQELDLPFEAIALDLREGQGQTPEYLKINPTGKVPTLVDGEFVAFAALVTGRRAAGAGA